MPGRRWPSRRLGVLVGGRSGGGTDVDFMAVVVEAVVGSHFGGAPPILEPMLGGDWDVHWGYGLTPYRGWTKPISHHEMNHG